jgi:hypothetical protein
VEGSFVESRRQKGKTKNVTKGMEQQKKNRIRIEI